MIQRWGGIGYLVRANVQRAATMARLDYTPKERGLFLDGSSRIRISVIGLVTPPDFEQDTIIYKGELYKIMMPADGPRATNEFVFYDCNVMFVQLDAS
jgi:hypothetical protein